MAEAIDRFILAGREQRRTSANKTRAIAESEYGERLVVAAYRSAVIALTGKGS
jgi:hypothetical protein